MPPPQNNQPGRILYHADEPRRPMLPAPAPSRRPPRKKRKKPVRWKRAGLVALLGVLGLLVLGAAGVVAGRAWAESYAAEQLKTKAQARGWDLSWSTLEIGYDLILTVKSVRATHVSQSFILVDTTSVRWTFADLIKGSIDPRQIYTEGFVADIDVGALRSEKTAKPTRSGTSKSRLGSLEKRLKATHIDLQRGMISLRNLPSSANAAGVRSISLQNIALQGAPKPDGWNANFKARCTDGCGEAQEISGDIHHRQGAISASVDLERPVALRLPDRGKDLDLTAQIKHFSGHLDAGGLKRAVARDVVVPVATDLLHGTLRIEEVAVENPSQSEARAVVLTRPQFRGFRPGASGGHEGVYQDEHSEEYEAPKAKLPEIPMPLSFRRIIDKALPHLASITVKEGDIHLTGADLHISQINAAPDTARPGAYRVEGALSSGQFAVVAQTQAPHLEIEFKTMQIQPFAKRYIPKIGDRIDGFVTGQVRFDLDQENPDTPGIYRADGRLKLEDATLTHEKLTPVGILQKQLGVEFTASYRPVSGELHDRFELKSMALDFPSRVKGRTARVLLAGDIENVLDEAPVRWNSRIWLEETPCDIAIGAIPRGMIPHIWDQVKATGSFAPSLELNVDMANIQNLTFEIGGLPGSCKIQSMGKYSPKYLNGPFRQEVREGVSRRGIFVGPKSGRYARLWSIPRYVTAAMYYTEEAAFRSNPGFAVSLIRRALKLNFEHMRYVYGGSSIEQQLVKNMFLTRSKTLSRKLEEAFIVWRMGDLLSKDRIIELYMNCIEFGPDIYGIARASWFYFGKSPSQLKPMEGVFLAALKPAPNTGLNPKRVGHTPTKGWWHKRMSNVMRRLFERGFIGREEYMKSYPFVLYFPGHGPKEEEGEQTQEAATDE